MKNIGWFTTARGPGSLNLFSTMLENIDSGSIDARVSFLFINRDVKGNQFRARMIRTAEERDIPVVILPSDSFRPELRKEDQMAWRDEYGKMMRKSISAHRMDFGVLAGYMLILDPETCREYDIINLHPALPETYKGTWEEVIAKVVENGDDSYGATIHLCTPELDRGETIAYDRFDITDLRSSCADNLQLAKMIRTRGVEREAYLLMEVVKMLVDGEIMIAHGTLVDRNGKGLAEHPNIADRVDIELERKRNG